jgi:hypothetical protein
LFLHHLLGDAHVTPRNIQEIQASKIGDTQGSSFFINKISGHLSRHYIFIASYAMRLYFCFYFSFALFVVTNGWIPTYFFWRRHTPFSLPRTL